MAEQQFSIGSGSGQGGVFEPIPKKSALIKTDKPRPHACPICTRGFARLEHLKRHERSHTHEKPFQCAACGRCFARRDLVLRHQQKLHTSLPIMPAKKPLADDSEEDKHINIVRNNTSVKLPLPEEQISPISSGEANSLFDTTPVEMMKKESTLKSVPDFTPESLFSMTPQEQHHESYREHRHASFSAATSQSYVGHEGSSEPVNVNDSVPNQVTFASPQLTPRDNLPDQLYGNMSDLIGLDIMTVPQEENNSSKSFKDAVGSPITDDWLAEFINAPIDHEFPAVSSHIGFVDTPPPNENVASPSKTPHGASPPIADLGSFFRTRQLDLFKKIDHKNNSDHERFTNEMRDYVITTYDLKPSQFPNLDDLNRYLSLYEYEFTKYFPFVHLGSLSQSFEHISLLLSMASIGALYSFHARNSSILFNFSRFLIHNYMEQKMGEQYFTDVPLYITQSLLLHMFLGMFHNDVEVTALTPRQLNSLVSLVKTTNLTQPLENFVTTPAVDLKDPASRQQCFEYFVQAQSRIRTVHSLYYLGILCSCIIGQPIALSADDMNCGIPCKNEGLWLAKNAEEWYACIKNAGITVDSKFKLVEISNGAKMPFRQMWKNLQNHLLNNDSELGLKCMFSLLMSVNGEIYNDRTSIGNMDQRESVRAMKWRMISRPKIESLIKSWESLYVRNDGVLVPTGNNLHLINQTPHLKLILPLLSFAKIRKCLGVTPILGKVWKRDWEGLNFEMKSLESDPEALRDGSNYSLAIINLWIEIISITKDAEKTSVRTPIFFLTCIFTSILIVSEYLYLTEKWAENYLENYASKGSNQSSLTPADRVLWLRTETILKKVEKNLLPKGSNNASYAEFLRIQANGALDVDTLDDEIAALALNPNGDIDLKPIAEIVQSGRLSTKTLSLGVRILADAPVWPVALVFAEALKARATHIHQGHTQGVSPPFNKTT